MPEFSHGFFGRQVPSVTMVQTAVQKPLSFWTAPSLVALSPCLRDDPTGGAGAQKGSLCAVKDAAGPITFLTVQKGLGEAMQDGWFACVEGSPLDEEELKRSFHGSVFRIEDFKGEKLLSSPRL